MQKHTLASSANVAKPAKSKLRNVVFLSLSMFLLGSATANAEVFPKYDGLTLETVSVTGNHESGDTLTLTYKDENGKEIVKTTATSPSTKNATSFAAIPLVADDWNGQGEHLVCKLSESKCELKKGEESKLTKGGFSDPITELKFHRWASEFEDMTKLVMGIDHTHLDDPQNRLLLQVSAAKLKALKAQLGEIIDSGHVSDPLVKLRLLAWADRIQQLSLNLADLNAKPDFKDPIDRLQYQKFAFKIVSLSTDILKFVNAPL